MNIEKSGFSDWEHGKSKYLEATEKAKHIGRCLLSKESAIECELVLYKKKLKGRTNLNRSGKESWNNESRRAARSAREPWLLATSLNVSEITVMRIVEFYTSRMQIEENFRDSKSHESA